MPAKAFSAPGPYCIAKTPGGLPFCTREQPSAMWTPTRSWRQMIGRMPAATAASMIGVVGKQNRVWTPSRLRISEIASMTCIVSLPSGLFARRTLARAPRRRHPRWMQGSGGVNAGQQRAAMRAGGEGVFDSFGRVAIGQTETFTHLLDRFHRAVRQDPLSKLGLGRPAQHRAAQPQLV